MPESTGSGLPTGTGAWRKVVYLDNAATSFPKPPEVVQAVTRFLTDIGASPNRSGHRLGTAATRVVFEARLLLAEFFGVTDPGRVIFTSSCTEALNVAIKGLFEEGDHVITTALEHNSVLRPLRRLEAQGRIRLTIVTPRPDGLIHVDDLRRELNQETRMVALTLASNVTGAISPVAEVAELVHGFGRPGRHKKRSRPLLLVDAAQGAGTLPLNMTRDGIDILAFAGHKGLLGPMGTGGLCLSVGVEPTPLIEGGTGTESGSDLQPRRLPEALESGTLNGPGIAGLAAGVRFLQQKGVHAAQRHQREILTLLLDGLRQIQGLRILSPAEPSRCAGVVSITLPPFTPGELCHLLDERYGILTRAGLHCAPLAHRALGTYPEGTLRISIGAGTSAEDVLTAVSALKEVAESATLQSRRSVT